MDRGGQRDDDEVDHNDGEHEDAGDQDDEVDQNNDEADHKDGEHDHLVVLGGGLATDPV